VPKHKKAFAYLRVSGKGQVRGDGFARQREAIEGYARRARLRVEEWFEDAGVSGTKELEAREGLAALLDRLEANGGCPVLVERADRLARDLLVGEIILSRLRDAGAQVIAADSGTDLTAGDDADPTTQLIRQVLGAVAQFEKAVLVLKLRAARRRVRQRKGRCEGVKPYGTRSGEAKIVERIKQLRRKPKKGKRLSFAKIADRLNAEGAPTRRGGPWKAGTIHGILDAEKRRKVG